jgi:hypothetical protein
MRTGCRGKRGTDKNEEDVGAAHVVSECGWVQESGRERGRKRREGLRARATAERTYINGVGNDVTRLPFSSASASAVAQADDVLRSGACCYPASSIQSILALIPHIAQSRSPLFVIHTHLPS